MEKIQTKKAVSIRNLLSAKKTNQLLKHHHRKLAVQMHSMKYQE